MRFITFKHKNKHVNKARFDELHARIMKDKPHLDRWAHPIEHSKKPWLAMPIDDSCASAMSKAELASAIPHEEMKAQGWFKSTYHHKKSLKWLWASLTVAAASGAAWLEWVHLHGQH